MNILKMNTLYDPTGVIEKILHIQEKIQERFTKIFQKGLDENIIIVLLRF